MNRQKHNQRPNQATNGDFRHENDILTQPILTTLKDIMEISENEGTTKVTKLQEIYPAKEEDIKDYLINCFTSDSEISKYIKKYVGNLETVRPLEEVERYLILDHLMQFTKAVAKDLAKQNFYKV